MDELTKAILRTDLTAFIRKVFETVDPNAKYLYNWHIGLISEYLQACQRGEIKRLIINIPPRHMKSISLTVAFSAWLLGHNASEQIMSASYSLSLSEKHSLDSRLVIESEWYRELFPNTRLVEDQNTKKKFVTTERGHRIATSVGGTATGEGGNFLFVDDPHSAEEAQSDIERERANNWFARTFSTRLNNKKTGCIVIIMQRLHENDLAGCLLKKGGWEILKIPLMAEEDEILQKGSVRIERKRGDILHPERMGEIEIEHEKRELGPYGFCTPKESPILMADLSLKSISKIEVGDKVIGINIDKESKRCDESYSRRFLIEGEVKAISETMQKVVRITLDSGKVIRCTSNHEWLSCKGRTESEPKRKNYKPAKIGSKLLRICDDSIPELRNLEDIHDAGWLAGFFDGEGSVSCVKARNKVTSLITFTQGSGRNLPLCNKLESILNKFGFEYNVNERLRSDRVNIAHDSPLSRTYYLLGDRLPLNQKFLHMIKPSKWRDKMVKGALGSNFVTKHERVLNIEYDGIEEVYGLTTTTGNYIVWGIASGNSGQYQQRPSPEGGGKFKEEWIQRYDKLSLETLNKYFLVDPANSKSNKSDYSSFWVIGAGGDKNYYAADIVRDRLNLKERIDTLFDLHIKYKPMEVLYQCYGMEGDIQAIEMEMERRNYRFSITPVRNMAHKEARIERLIPPFANKKIYFPKELYKTDYQGKTRDLVEDFIQQEYKAFPVGLHDDMLDSLSMIFDTNIIFPGTNTVNYNKLYAKNEWSKL